jgi:Cu(I)/Ag(I) efflux system periplasmic protein CusF
MIRLALTAALALATATSFAQSGGMKGMDMDKGTKGMEMEGMKSEAKAGESHHAKGTVSKVDKQAGSVTINHDPVASMNWPKMNMRFKVKDKELLGKAKPGSQIEFTFVQSGKDYVVTEIR